MIFAEPRRSLRASSGDDAPRQRDPIIPQCRLFQRDMAMTYSIIPPGVDVPASDYPRYVWEMSHGYTMVVEATGFSPDFAEKMAEMEVEAPSLGPWTDWRHYAINSLGMKGGAR